MKAIDLSKYVSKQFAQGMTEQQIAASLGISVEAMYRKMAEGDEKNTDQKEKKYRGH